VTKWSSHSSCPETALAILGRVVHNPEQVLQRGLALSDSLSDERLHFLGARVQLALLAPAVTGMLGGAILTSIQPIQPDTNFVLNDLADVVERARSNLQIDLADYAGNVSRRPVLTGGT
jgi:hypothetical protein